jgi:hypothetical protein
MEKQNWFMSLFKPSKISIFLQAKKREKRLKIFHNKCLIFIHLLQQCVSWIWAKLTWLDLKVWFRLSQVTLASFALKITTSVSSTDLDHESEMIIFQMISTTFEASSIFTGRWGNSKIFFKFKIKPT